MATTKCKLCTKTFIKDHHNQLYCSVNCRANKKPGHLSLRFNVLLRDKFRCVYCGESSIENDKKLHVDHIILESLGGPYIMENLITACKDCNLGRHILQLPADILTRLYKKIQ